MIVHLLFFLAGRVSLLKKTPVLGYRGYPFCTEAEVKDEPEKEALSLQVHCKNSQIL